MIAHTTSISLVSENKVLCHPSSIDSIPTSANQEDHQAMAGTFFLLCISAMSGRKCLKVIENVEKVMAIELICAA